MDWSKIKYFTADEFRCRYSHRVDMDQDFVEALDELRERFGKPIKINSGFRDRFKHPIEARKNSRGAHTTGKAADIGIRGKDAIRLLEIAMEMGVFTGFGISQKGNSRFIHLDSATRSDLGGTPRPALWSY